MENGAQLTPDILTLSSILLLDVVLYSIFKRVRMPYTIGLVIVGLLLGGIGHLYDHERMLDLLGLNPDRILYVVLPPLVFDACVNMDTQLLRRMLAPILILATAGVLISTLVVGLLLHWLTPMGWFPAMLFGAMTSATDPVAVIALFRELKAPAALSMLMDGESLFNDATGIAIFQTILLFSTVSFSFFSLSEALGSFLLMFVGGAVIGAICGLIGVALTSIEKHDGTIQLVIQLVTAYVSFLIANDYLGLSGIMATVAAGLIFNWRLSRSTNSLLKSEVLSFWELAAFIANSYIFLMMGIKAKALFNTVDGGDAITLFLVYAIVTVLIARIFVVYLLIPLYNGFRKKPSKKISWQENIIIYWGGLRGAVPMTLALSLSESIPYHALLFKMTLVVIIWSLVVQGMTMPSLLKKLLPSTL